MNFSPPIARLAERLASDLEQISGASSSLDPVEREAARTLIEPAKDIARKSQELNLRDSLPWGKHVKFMAHDLAGALNKAHDDLTDNASDEDYKHLGDAIIDLIRTANEISDSFEADGSLKRKIKEKLAGSIPKESQGIIY